MDTKRIDIELHMNHFHGLHEYESELLNIFHTEKFEINKFLYTIEEYRNKLLNECMHKKIAVTNSSSDVSSHSVDVSLIVR